MKSKSKGWKVIFKDITSKSLDVRALIMATCMLSVFNHAYGDDDVRKRKIELSDKWGNKVVHESVGGIEEEDIHGVIKIYSKNGELKYFKDPVPPPGCDTNISFPIILQTGIKQKNDEITVLCGDTGAGRHQVLTFIQHGEVIDSLDIGGGDGVVEWSQNASTLIVAGKYSYPNEDDTLGTYMVLYERAIPSFNGNKFRPIFNSRSASKYFEYYEKLKGFYLKKNGKNVTSSMLAALISTMDRKLICSEIHKEPIKSLSLKSLINTSIYIQRYGYPSFDFSVCGKDY